MIRSLLLLLCLPAYALAGDLSAQVGRLVVISSELEGSTTVDWYLANEPYPNSYKVVDGRNVVFASDRPGTFVFLEIGALQGTDKPSIEKKEHRVVVSGGTTLTPVDPPQIDPPSVLGLDAFVREMFQALPPERAQAAERLRMAYLLTVKGITDGTIKTVDEAKSHQRSVNQKALEGETEHWASFGSQLQSKLEELKAQGKLPTLDAHKQAYREIAKGLTP
jgi:hypothetical protein